MIIGIPIESHPHERRLALVPAQVRRLRKRGFEFLVEHGAGERAGYPDAEFEAAGARLAIDRDSLFGEADLIATLRRPGHGRDAEGDLRRLRRGQTLVGLLDPLGALDQIPELAETGVTSFALELLPRITRAQAMDALTSMATVAGYRAVLLAAGALDKIFPLMMTAAGTVAPAHVLVIGAGVAGLQAIATSHRLGAVVRAYDVRPAVREQVESLGARFVDLGLETDSAETTGGYARAQDESFYREQRARLGDVVAESDVVISTAAIPGTRAPLLIDAAAVARMRRGAVIVDLAAETGGNCELTQPGGTIDADGVTVMGPLDVAASVPFHASQMYAANVAAFVENLVKDGALQLDLEDEIVRETLLTHDGSVVHPRIRNELGWETDPATERGK